MGSEQSLPAAEPYSCLSGPTHGLSAGDPLLVAAGCIYYADSPECKFSKQD